jgi:hypothetical protein
MNVYETERVEAIQKSVQELQSAIHSFLNSVPSDAGDRTLRAKMFHQIGVVLAGIIILKRGTPGSTP